MAQLRDSTIDGNLNVTGDVILETDKSIFGIHPASGETSNMLHMSENGNIVVGHGSWDNKNGNTHIYGNDIVDYVASAGVNFRPYYRAGDTINFTVRTAGYVTNSGKDVMFTIPITKPVIGAPTATATSDSGRGFVLRQNNTYTHGSAASTYVNPASISIETNYNSGFIVKASFTTTTNVINNNPIGVYWDGTITLS